MFRTGGRLTVPGETGHAWFVRASQASLPRRTETLPAIRAAEQVLARQDRTVGKRAVRIPADAFVSIASRALPAPAAVLQLAGPASAAAAAGPAPPGRAPKGARLRSAARSAFFILVMLATVALAYWAGRMRGYENVIVVPGPSSSRSAIV